MRKDLQIWLAFLRHPAVFCRPFLDFSKTIITDEIHVYSDASGKIRMGALYGSAWMPQTWSPGFLESCNPSIEYLELFAVTTAVLAWIHLFKNRRIILSCDNKSVVDMINLTSTTCKSCMVLIRLIVLTGLIENVKIFAKHVSGVKNNLADSLSKNNLYQFYKDYGVLGKVMDSESVPVPDVIWPVEKIWKK